MYTAQRVAPCGWALHLCPGLDSLLGTVMMSFDLLVHTFAHVITTAGRSASTGQTTFPTCPGSRLALFPVLRTLSLSCSLSGPSAAGHMRSSTSRTSCWSCKLATQCRSSGLSYTDLVSLSSRSAFIRPLPGTQASFRLSSLPER